MPSSGPNIAGTAVGTAAPGTGGVWTNPGYVTADDNQFARLVSVANQESGRVKAYNFGFNVPDNTITGIVVTFGAAFFQQLQSPDQALNFRLLDASGAGFGNTYQVQIGTDEGASQGVEVTYTIPSNNNTSDTWGVSLTSSIVNDVDFGVEFWGPPAGTLYDLGVDWIKITVYYIQPSEARLNGISSNQISSTTRSPVFNTAISYVNAVNSFSTTANNNGVASYLVVPGVATEFRSNSGSYVATQPSNRSLINFQSVSSVSNNIALGTTFVADSTASVLAVPSVTTVLQIQSQATTNSVPLIGSTGALDSFARLSAAPSLTGNQYLNALSSTVQAVTFSSNVDLNSCASVQSLSIGEGAALLSANSTIDALNSYSFEANVDSVASIVVLYTIGQNASISGIASSDVLFATQGNTTNGAAGYVEVPTQGTSIGLQANANLMSQSFISAVPSIQSIAGMQSKASITAEQQSSSSVGLLGLSTISNAYSLSSEVVLVSDAHFNIANSYSTDSRLQSTSSLFAQKSDEGFSFLLSSGNISVQQIVSTQNALNSIASFQVVVNTNVNVDLESNSTLMSVGFPQTKVEASAVSSVQVSYSSNTQINIASMSSLNAQPSINGVSELLSISFLEALHTGGVEVKYGIRSPRFGILGVPFGSFTNVTSDADLIAITGIEANPYLAGQSTLASIALLNVEYQTELVTALTSMASLDATPEPVFELCPCPEYEQDQTPTMTTEHGGDVVACTINRKGCD